MSIKIYIKCLLTLSLILFNLFHADAQVNKELEKCLQNRGEAYIKFENIDKKDVQLLNKLTLLDKVVEKDGVNDVYSYLTTAQLDNINLDRFKYKVQTAPSMLSAATMCSSLNDVRAWNCYPTYSQYLELMTAFAQDYPELCKLEEIGESVNGRKLLVLKLSDNVQEKEDEPEVFLTSTIHGDETTGYVLMLRFIDYLLSNYDNDTRVQSILNNTELWINPNSNPDGTYYLSNNDVFGARRINFNGVDLNRNYPDPAEGDHPDGNSWQKETVAMMDFMKLHNFSLSANFHGGAEVLNYPWDTWFTRHADDEWFQNICREYADTVHVNSVSGYMDDLENGITNGADWYSIAGGRQDYVTYFLHGREVTMEISNDKNPPGETLPTYWDSNFRSFLNYIDEVQFGVFGKVTDIDGLPLYAKLTVENHDVDSSEVYTSKSTGSYYRMISSGTYTITASKPGYYSMSKEVIVSSADDRSELNFVLEKYKTGLISEINITELEYNNLAKEFFNIKFKSDLPDCVKFSLFDMSGKNITEKGLTVFAGSNEYNINISHIKEGVYTCLLSSERINKRIKVVVRK